MENLFFLLVLLIIIVTNVLNIKKKMKKQQPGAPETQPGQAKQERQGGWRQSVEELLEYLKDELEPASDKESAGHGRKPGRPRDVLPEETEYAHSKAPELRGTERAYNMAQGRESLIEKQARDEGVSRRRVAVSRKESEAIRGDVALGTPSMGKTAPAAPTPAQEFSATPGSAYSVAQLQRAVIWSEVLGHPVALRKKARGETWL